MTMKYPFPAINSLNDGAQLDVRFRLAQHLLATPGFLRYAASLPHSDDSRTAHGAARVAEIACQLAEQLWTEGESRGWVETLSMSATLSGPERKAVERTTAANVHGQLHRQKLAQESQPSVMTPRNIMNG